MIKLNQLNPLIFHPFPSFSLIFHHFCWFNPHFCGISMESGAQDFEGSPRELGGGHRGARPRRRGVGKVTGGIGFSP
jgi:hypothetical protein